MAGPMGADELTSAPGIQFEIAPLPDRDVSFIDRLSEYPRGPDMLGEGLRAIGRTACVGLMRVQYRIEVEGVIPSLPRMALAANHQSHLDALTVLAALPGRRRRELAVLAARDYFFSRAARGAAAGVFAAAVPFDRTRATELRSWARRLQAQPRGTILFFPSGSRRRSEAQRGMLLVMARSGWPIIPVALRGTREAWPVGARLWRPFRRLTVTVGEPLDPSGAVDLAERLDAFWAEHA
jgi:1-acyl-sn-glycerol-3-phosphate acyltransferase